MRVGLGRKTGLADVPGLGELNGSCTSHPESELGSIPWPPTDFLYCEVQDHFVAALPSW